MFYKTANLKIMKYSLLFVAILFCLLSCSKKDDCKEQTLTLKHLEDEYGCPDTRHSLIVNLTNNCILIRSKESYDSQVSGTCHPEINFTLYDLVIGKQATANSVDTIIYDLKRTCPKSELTLSVQIIQGLETVPDNVVYHALIPKPGDEESLNIEINVK